MGRFGAATLRVSLFLIMTSGNGYGQTRTVTPVRPFSTGDAVRIFCFPDTAHFINGVYHIDDNGYIMLPVVGKAKIDTMSEKVLVEYLDTAYFRYLRYPNMQVQPLIRISLLGGFHHPGMYYIAPSASLWDAIAMAGGTIREDGLNKIYWERQRTRLHADVSSLIESGKSLETLGIKSGDRFSVTPVLKLQGWERFRTDVLPVIGIAVAALSAVATVYIATTAYHGEH